MDYKNEPTTGQQEAAMTYLIREIKNSNSIFEQEELRSALAEVAFRYTQGFPKYRTEN